MALGQLQSAVHQQAGHHLHMHELQSNHDVTRVQLKLNHLDPILTCKQCLVIGIPDGGDLRLLSTVAAMLDMIGASSFC